MSSRNLRHLRLFLAVVDQRSQTRAAQICHVSQPAVSQAMASLEQAAGGALIDRGHGVFATERGGILAARVRRAFAILDPALAEIAPRLKLTLSHAQLQSLIAAHDCQNFTLAARRLGVAQPTVHRAVAQVEQEAGRHLFDRSPQGMMPSRLCQALTQAGRLALYELAQADADLAAHDGREMGGIVIGAMPLARSVLLPRALVAFRADMPLGSVKVLDGPYDDLLAGLRRGEIDLLIGALRDPAPIGDIVQQPLFDDKLVLISGRDHPLAHRQGVCLSDLAAHPWVVPRVGTPARAQFQALFDMAGLAPPASIIESGSILLMRQMLDISPHLACISAAQAQAEITRGNLVALDFPMETSRRAIGITTRLHWLPTAAQRRMVQILTEQQAQTA